MSPEPAGGTPALRSKPRPFRAGARGLHGSFEKCHAVDAVVDGRKIVLAAFAIDSIANRGDGFKVNVGKRFDKRFGMAERQAREFFCGVRHVTIAATQGPRRLAFE